MNDVKRWGVAAAGLVMLGMSAGACAVTVSLSPSSSTIGVGGTTSVEVVVAGLGDQVAPSIGVFDINVSFDPGVLGLDGVIFGAGLDVLGSGSLQITDDSLPGAINVYELSLDAAQDLDALQPAAFTLFTLLFQGLGAGTSPLTVSLNILGDASGDALDADVSGGELTVTVSEPAAAWLLLAGLAGLGALSRAARSRRQRPAGDAA
jgi:hypothetical protein